jgi:hypothetical protein
VDRYTPAPGFYLNVAEITPSGPLLRFGPGGTNLLYRILTASELGSDWEVADEINSGSDILPQYELLHTNAPPEQFFYRLQVLDGGDQ